ncbi:MAG: glycoside hydrolase [Syntrophobacterales bacterium CG_4_8_14_3_um_filter_58_8]|nr:MAG: glycoside hydrolase [Syntrophobacterales bacterium CG_4_8_14_3_um_filter_58_8]
MTKIAVTGLRGVPATWGGVEHHCENLYSRLAERGYDITIYARSYYVPRGITSYKGLKIKRLPTLNLKYTDALFHTLFSMIHILFSNPDIVHIHGIGPCFFSWLPRVFRPRMKVFFTCHGLDWQRKKWPWWASKLIYLGELSAIRFAQYRVVVSRELQQYFESAHGIKTFYIPNGITPIPPKEPNRIKQWGLSAGRYFLCVGRLVPEKRMEDIIKAYLLNPRGYSLVIVGDNASAGQYMNDLIKLAENTPSVIFTGYQFGTVLEELFSNARAFITASELEGLPITLLEALSYGIMCVTSDIGPHRELMETLPGLTFPVGDIPAIAKQMNYMETMTENQYDDFKQKAIAMISGQFSWNTACGEHDRLYRKSLQH